MLVSPAEQPLLAEQQSRLERVLQIARTNDTEAALRSYVNVILDADVFDKLPEGSRVVIRDNFSTLAPHADHVLRAGTFRLQQRGAKWQ